MASDERDAREKKRLWRLLILLELLLMTGPFLIAQLHVAYCDWRGLPAPERFWYMPLMMGTGFLLLAALALRELFLKLKRLISREH